MTVNDIRNQFPILDTVVHDRPLVYLDNAATTQKPLAVVEALSDYYLHLNSNIHRGAHHLAAEATERYESVRRQVQQFINARHHHEIVFTRGTTESINLVASSFDGTCVKAMRLSSPAWNITPISFLGSWPVQCYAPYLSATKVCSTLMRLSG